jgi:hypothetical protein
MRDLGPGHPDGAHGMRSALQHSTAARRAYVLALQRFVNFVVGRSVPDDLQER